MAEESLGQARIDVVVASDTYTADLNKMAAATSKFTGEAQKEYDALSKREQARVDRMRNQINTVGLAYNEQLKYNIALKTSGAIQQQLNKDLEVANRRLEENVRKTNQYGLTAKQTAAAMRGVPAQLTDIAVSLQGGQAPLTVLLQQGGQLKDMFGGVVPAVRALGGALLGLVNPYTVAAAAGAGLLVAWYQGSQEARAYSAALIMTGNAATQTVDSLASLAQELDNIQGVTEGKAAAVITQVVATGRIASENVEQVTRAALAMQDATGTAIEDTIAQFVELEKDPVKALLKLNETQRFLTQATLDQVKAFVEQGKEAEAASLAVSTYADTVIGRTNNVRDELGLLQREWRRITWFAKEAWDAMLNIGREDTLEEKIEEQKRLVQGLKVGRYGYQYELLSPAERQRQTKEAENELARLQRELKPVTVTMAGIYATVDPAVQKAREDFDKIRESNLTKQEKLEKEIAKIRQLGAKAGIAEAEVEKQVLAAREQARDKSKGRTGDGGLANAQMSRELQALKDQLSQEQAAIKNSRDMLQAEYAAKTISVEDYYARLKELSQQGTDAETQSLEAQIKVLQRRNATGRDSENVQRQQLTLETQLAKARADGANEQAVLDTQATAALQKRTNAIQAYAAALDNTTLAQRREMDAMVTRVKLGDREFEIQTKINGVYFKQADLLRELANQKKAGEIDEKTYEANVQAVEKATQDMVEVIKEGYAELAAAESDWVNGATAAFQNYLTEGQNVAKQTQDVFTNALGIVEDGFVDLALTGKLSIKTMLADILKEVVKFLMKQAIVNFISSFGGGGGNSGTLGDLFGNTGSFAGGGYTGPGGVFEPAGVVHKGEVVWSQTDVARAGGVAAVEAMRRGFKGYAGGGSPGLAPARAPASIGPEVNFTYAPTFQISGDTESNVPAATEDRKYLEEFARKNEAATKTLIQRSMAPGGDIYNYVRNR